MEMTALYQFSQRKQAKKIKEGRGIFIKKAAGTAVVSPPKEDKKCQTGEAPCFPHPHLRLCQA